MATKILTSRRSLIATASALLVASASNLTLAQAKRRATPSQTEGPYYPVKEPKDADFDLLKNGDRIYAKGRASWVEGVVTDLDGRPLNGGVIEIWQCDDSGHYDHPADGAKIDPSFQGFGRVRLNADGEFRFRTIRPSPYVGRTPHIHAKILLGSRELLTTQLYVADDPGNAKDGIWRRMSEADRAAVTSAFVPVADGLRAQYALAVKVTS
jgi:protocatechuate 3,4-dioxygenase, beta subunit